MPLWHQLMNRKPLFSISENYSQHCQITLSFAFSFCGRGFSFCSSGIIKMVMIIYAVKQMVLSENYSQHCQITLSWSKYYSLVSIGVNRSVFTSFKDSGHV
jgi:hypothetical protein